MKQVTNAFKNSDIRFAPIHSDYYLKKLDVNKRFIRIFRLLQRELRGS